MEGAPWLTMGYASRLRKSQGDFAMRVLCDDWSDLDVCLQLVGDSRLERHVYQLAAANAGQIVSLLAIFRIFERDAL